MQVSLSPQNYKQSLFSKHLSIRLFFSLVIKPVKTYGVWIICLLFFCCGILYPEDDYTTSIHVKNILSNKVAVTWKASLPKATFNIYRSAQKPISDVKSLASAELVASVDMLGVSNYNLFQFTNFVDTVKKEGDYYYFVAIKKDQYMDSDFLPELNYTATPTKVEWKTTVTNESPKTNIVKPEEKKETNKIVKDAKTNDVKPPKTNTVKPIDKPIDKTLTNKPIEPIKVVLKPTNVIELEVDITTNNRIVIEWKANVKEDTFAIYRYKNFPIGNPEILKKAKLLKKIKLQGEYKNFMVNSEKIYEFKPYQHTLKEDGLYYFAVLPERKKYQNEDFVADENYTTEPIVMKGGIQTNILLVTNLFVRKYEKSFQLFWNVHGLDSEEEEQKLRFDIYRTHFPVTNNIQLFQLSPYTNVNNEFFLEDTDIEYGKPYYYTVILNKNLTVSVGRNASRQPLFFGVTNVKVEVVEERTYTNISAVDFESKFKK